MARTGKIKLGVNIDHVATLRQARRTIYPDIYEAAVAVTNAGADGITIHLREDRRHIQDADVPRLAADFRVNLEMAATEEMKTVALTEPKPHSVCIVPESREELTTEGGLNAVGMMPRLREFVSEIKEAGVLVSLFVDPDVDQIEASAQAGADYVELHTGSYANLYIEDSKSDASQAELLRLHDAAEKARELGLKVNAGHGLDTENVHNVLDISGLEELNIGFSIVARGLFVGLENAVVEMKEAITNE
ncbi:MAG: pyridoxine 5'-phosphate synthase [Candidatus Lindowbacteria bacterium]|nr:pyridoxine 5'-phosphate synthase [Candidatus Lindowbacteria bacterium]